MQWTSSLVWESDEHKLRKRFKRFKESLRVSGFGRSPFAPRDLCEYIKIQLATIVSKIKVITAQLCQLTRCHRRTLGWHPSMFEVDRHAIDRLPISYKPPRLLSLSKPWDDAACADEWSWPSWPAFQEAGDRRVLRGGNREFPQPHNCKLNGGSFQTWAGTRSLLSHGLEVPCQYHETADGGYSKYE
ncbi:hypothetical protein GGR55DRAFT_204485 [Xylaria sp. FL0064]|nr:hypothetical protein GGR55DRAFT_204485 [Xylaria sp. FL0064]